MNPLIDTLGVEAVKYISATLIQYGPVAAKALAELLYKGNPTLEEWNALFDVALKSRQLEKTYAQWTGFDPEANPTVTTGNQ